ncbi:MAG: hypothetical protein WCC17_25395 [Candidatus Nitrosopolaris sp.]
MRVIKLDSVFIQNYDRFSGILNVEKFSLGSSNLNIAEDVRTLTNEQTSINCLTPCSVGLDLGLKREVQ